MDWRSADGVAAGAHGGAHGDIALFVVFEGSVELGERFLEVLWMSLLVLTARCRVTRSLGESPGRPEEPSSEANAAASARNPSARL
jgi:hypothetical protein